MVVSPCIAVKSVSLRIGSTLAHEKANARSPFTYQLSEPSTFEQTGGRSLWRENIRLGHVMSHRSHSQGDKKLMDLWSNGIARLMFGRRTNPISIIKSTPVQDSASSTFDLESRDNQYPNLNDPIAENRC